MLSDKQIRECVFYNEIAIDPFVVDSKAREEGRISYGLTSYGYDVRIGTEFKVFQPPTRPNQVYRVDPKAFSDDFLQDVSVADDPPHNYVVVPPNSFALGSTVEYLKIPRDLIALCVGKSTYARCGIVVNVTPLEPEWEGHITIEISNTTPLPAVIYAHEGIAQVMFSKGDDGGICEVSYADKKGKYQNQQGLTLPRLR